jgi:hypothetical protein
MVETIDRTKNESDTYAIVNGDREVIETFRLKITATQELAYLEKMYGIPLYIIQIKAGSKDKPK